MSEHYTRNTTGVMKFCQTCNKKTMHKVSGKRIGSCTEAHARSTQAKVYEQPEPSLFEGAA